MALTYIDWLKHFDRDVIQIKQYEDPRRDARAYLRWDPLNHIVTNYESPSAYSIFIDKLPTTPEGCKLYIMQSFSQVARSLYDDGQALDHEFWRWDFNFEQHHPVVQAKIDTLQILLRAMKLPPKGYNNYVGVEIDSPYNFSEYVWVGEFYSLIFHAEYVKLVQLIGEDKFPDGMKFWK